MKLLTYNIRNESACDGVNAFHNRRGYVIDQLETEKPDIIGFQEITQPMYPYFREHLHGYTLIGCGRDADYRQIRADRHGCYVAEPHALRARLPV